MTYSDPPGRKTLLMRSMDNGITWDSLNVCCESYENEVIPEISMTYTGNSEENLKIYCAWIWNDTVINYHISVIWRFNGLTGVRESINYFDTFEPNHIDIVNNQSDSGADAVGIFVESDSPLTQERIILLAVSTDECMTYNVLAAAAYHDPAIITSASIGFGRYPGAPDGKFFGAWGVYDSPAQSNHHIYTAHSQTDIYSLFTTPVCIDSLNPMDINKCRNPIVATQNGLINNDSSNLTSVVLFERVDDLTGKTDIKGYYNLQSTTSSYFRPLSFTNSSHNNLQPDICFNPYDSSFVVTWFDSTTFQLKCSKNDLNMSAPNTWTPLSNGYNDEPNIKAPKPRISVSPTEKNCAFVWNSEGTDGKGIASFDAVYSTFTDINNMLIDSEINKVKIYPNPSSTIVNIEFELIELSPIKLSLSNLLGQPVLRLPERILQKGINHIRLTVSELLQGYYLLYIETHNSINAYPLYIFR